MNPLEFEKYVKDMSLNSGFTKLMEKLLHSSKNELRDTPVTYLGEGKNGKVFRIGENTTIKLLKNINLYCEINNEYVKLCSPFYHEVTNGMILHNTRVEEKCPNFPELKGAYYTNNTGIIVRDYSDFVFSDFLKSTNYEKIINNLIMQYFLTIALLHAKYQSNIMDNKFANIYVKKTNAKKLVYNIENKKYEIECFGYVIVIGDYGSCRFNYPTKTHFVQIYKYIESKYLKIPVFELESFQKWKKNKPLNEIKKRELRIEKGKQIYLIGLFNPYLEHVFFMSMLLAFSNDNNRNFPIIDKYCRLTNYNRSGFALLRKNILLVDIIAAFAKDYNIQITPKTSP